MCPMPLVPGLCDYSVQTPHMRKHLLTRVSGGVRLPAACPPSTLMPSIALSHSYQLCGDGAVACCQWCPCALRWGAVTPGTCRHPAR